MSSDQAGYSGRTSEPGGHYHDGSWYTDAECQCRNGRPEADLCQDGGRDVDHDEDKCPGVSADVHQRRGENFHRDNADFDFPVSTGSGVRCGNHGFRQHVCHESVDAVRECYALSRELAAQQRAEIWAEDAWLRAAEAGNPDTWEEESRERMIEAYGYGPPPGV